ncbi:MAG: hypothetical protein JNM30_05345 [Rhodospirillales bacterium]|nr:hypothetical protein [Rhodospirillales bacterium]
MKQHKGWIAAVGPGRWWRRAAWIAPQLALTRGIVVASVVLIVVVWIGIVVQASYERERALGAAGLHTQNLARAAAEHTERVFRSIDQFTWTIKQIHESGRLDVDIAGLLRSSAILGDLITQAHITDAQGNSTVLMSMGTAAPVDQFDREHFQVHRDGRSKGIFVSRPVQGQPSGKWCIQVTRRLNAADGTFGGVVTVSIDPTYFGPFYQALSISDRDTFGVLGLDGGFRVRYPYDAVALQTAFGDGDALMHRLNSGEGQGTYVRPSRIDGVNRLFAFYRVANYPLVVAVGRPIDDIQSAASAHLSVYMGAALLFTCLVLLLGALLIKVSVREHDIHRRMMDALDRAESASQTKSAFLAHMSHELRTPLNAILGYSEAMALGIAGAVTPRGREYLGHVQSAGKQLLALVTDILDLSRLEAGKAELNEEKFALRPLAEQAIDMCRPSADKKRLAISVDPEAIDVLLLADRRAMLQMLLNLLANAVKFTEAGAVTVGWNLDGPRFVLAVRDTGVGIAEADIGRVIVAFERAGNAVPGKHEGVGLGLAIVANLARLHGGELKLRSAPGHGTSAQLYLPVSRVSPLRSEQATAA